MTAPPTTPPPRVSASTTNQHPGIVFLIAVVVAIAGILLFCAGFFSLLSHVACEAKAHPVGTVCPQPLVWPFPSSLLAVGLAALVIQLGDIRKALAVAAPLIEQMRPGWRRVTDPPAPPINSTRVDSSPIGPPAGVPDAVLPSQAPSPVPPELRGNVDPELVP